MTSTALPAPVTREVPQRPVDHDAPALPVIAGFHPDPSVCRVGPWYYLVNSSFEYAPGVPVHRSRDLRTWETVGHALARPSQLTLPEAAPSGGIFAPTLRHHDGRWWMITTNMSDGQWQLAVWADDPAGPWSAPIRFPAVVGIDPDLAWGDDGTCYLTYAGAGSTGPAGIQQVEVDLATGTVLTEPRLLWWGTGGKFPEGPHLYQVGEHWYLLIAEGGTERGHAVTIARGPSPSGPFEPSPHNPLMTARGSDLPVQNTGHADLVERPDGSWAMVYHGVRARGASPQWHVLGRETFAREVIWDDGWPRVGAALLPATDEPGIAEESQTTDELAGEQLPLSWVTPGRFPDDVLTRARDGWLLTAIPEASGGVAFAGRRQQHPSAVVQARLARDGGTGGLSVRLDPKHHVDIELEGDEVRALVQVGSVRAVLGQRVLPAGPGDVVLELRIAPPQGQRAHRAGPDEVVVGIATDDGFVELGRQDGRYTSTEVAGGFTGRMIGCYALTGSVLVRSFTYAGTEDPLVAG